MKTAGSSFRSSFNLPVAVVAVITLLVLPLLAYLQYSWLGQLSEQEFERMQKNVRLASFHFSMEISRELTALMWSVAESERGETALTAYRVQRSMRRWRNSATFPRVANDTVYTIPISKTEEYIRFRTDGDHILFLPQDLSSVLIADREESKTAFAVPIDKGYLVNELLPQLVKSNFATDSDPDYDIVVTDNNGNIFFSTDDSSSHRITASADITFPFFNPPPALGAGFPGERPPDDERFTRDRRFGNSPPPRKELSERESEKPPFGGEREILQRGIFRMYVKHRGGSLESVVRHNRYRNLAVGFGVLVLLGASIVFIVISSHRSQQLAHQQLEFVASVSHELRTPLAVLQSAGENLADGVIREQERTQRYGGLIKNEVARLSEMVEKSLMYAGIQSGKQSYEFQLLDLRELIDRAVAKVQKIYAGKNCTITVGEFSALPAIRGHASALQSALENLIVNGVKYGGDEPVVRIRTRIGQDHASVEIIVSDNGIGIPRGEIDHIFKPFHRGGNAVDRQIEGSGLGLSIAKHIVETHDGSIAVRSTMNTGSEFTIWLPAAAERGGAS